MPNFADTDGSTLKLVEEANFGVTPADSNAWKTVRAKGWSIKPTLGVVESEELSGSVDVLDATTVTKSGQWSVNGQYAKDTTLELMLEHLFRGAFAGNVLKGGMLKKSLSYEELTVGAANEFALIGGCRINTFSMSGRVGSIIDVSFAGTGGAVIPSGVSAVGAGAVAPATTTRPLSLSDLTSFSMTGDATSLVVLDFALNVTNNTRDQFGAGSTAPQGIGYGTRRVSGSYTAYFETREQFVHYNNSIKKDLSFVLTDGVNSHTWRLPAIKYLDGDKGVGGRSNDITHKFEFVATYNAAQATTAMVTRTA